MIFFKDKQTINNKEEEGEKNQNAYRIFKFTAEESTDERYALNARQCKRVPTSRAFKITTLI